MLLRRAMALTAVVTIAAIDAVATASTMGDLKDVECSPNPLKTK